MTGILVALCLHAATAQAQPTMNPLDRLRIATAFHLAETLGDSLWPGWKNAPFALLLITPAHEFLLRHPKPTQDWDRGRYDSLLGCAVYYRKRLLNTNLLATYPAVNGISTIVVGQAEQTERKNSTAWVMTILHEHFHQAQQSAPDYYSGVNALDLSGGDQTGMWMLNYPFPYDSSSVQEQFTRMCRALQSALETVGSPSFPTTAAEYFHQKERFRSILSPRDYRYYAFQCWQEGIARYTELRMAERAAALNFPLPVDLPDAMPFARFANDLKQTILTDLGSLDLGRLRRVAFYTIGAAEGLVLDAVNPRWRKQYCDHPFSLESYEKKP